MSKLKELREAKIKEAKRYTQAAMAKATGVSRPTYKLLEEHPERLTKQQAERLASHLGCETADIFL